MSYIAISDPTRSDGIDLNAEFHRELREQRKLDALINTPIEPGPIMSPEPVLPQWAIALAAMVLTPFALGYIWSFMP